MKPLYKAEIIIWCEQNPENMELSDLAREAETGDAYCSKMAVTLVADPSAEPDWDGTEFFDVLEEW